MSFKIRSMINKIFCNLQFHFDDKCRYVSTNLTKDSTKTESNLSQYIIVKATKEDYRHVLEVMHTSYYPYEPTCSSLGIGPNLVMDERAMKDMVEGMSLVARMKSGGEIVGACINCSLHPWDPDQTEKLALSCKCSKLKTLLLFYAHVTRSPDLWKSYGVERVFEMAYLFVKPEHRRKGIPLRLMEHSQTVARNKCFHVMRCDATNVATAKLCEKLGMRLVDEIPYSSFLGKTFEPVFETSPVNNSVKIYVDDNFETVKTPTDIDKDIEKGHTTPTK